MKVELFNEFFGCYFNTIYHILKDAANRELKNNELYELVQDKSNYYGFSDTTAFIVKEAIDLGKIEEIDNNKDAWPFFEKVNERSKDGSGFMNKSRLNNISGIPLSIIEKRWLKSIYSDPRIKLFINNETELPDLNDVEPFFDWNDYVLFDQYSDGDPFQDEHYIEMFHRVLKYVHNRSLLELRLKKTKGQTRFYPDGKIMPSEDCGVDTLQIFPDYIEYSERDNKFRLIGNNPRFGRSIVNISSIINCEPIEEFPIAEVEIKGDLKDNFQREVVFELSDNNNALERFLLNFSHYDKEAEYREEENKYLIKIIYDETDETDLVIRVLSFGEHVKVVKPQHFISLIFDRLQRQLDLNN